MALTGGFNFKIWPSLAIIMALAHRSESAGHQATDQRKITRKWQDVGTRFTEVNSAQFVPRWSWGSFIPYTDLTLTEINISAGNVLEDTVKLFLCQNTQCSQTNVTSSEWRRTWNFTPTSTDTGGLVSINQGHHYCSLKPLDATNFENDYPTAHVSFSATFGKERVNDNWAMCVSHTISNANTSAALEARPNTVRSCIGHRRGNRTFGFENASFVIKCLALGVNGYSAGWLQVKFCTKCMLHGCCWFCLCQMQETRTLLLHGSHFKIWRNLAPAATTNTIKFVWNTPLKVFLSTNLGVKVYVRRICWVFHCKCVKLFCGHSVGDTQCTGT
jgi:hypothetical protein